MNLIDLIDLSGSLGHNAPYRTGVHMENNTGGHIVCVCVRVCVCVSVSERQCVCQYVCVSVGWGCASPTAFVINNRSVKGEREAYPRCEWSVGRGQTGDVLIKRYAAPLSLPRSSQVRSRWWWHPARSAGAPTSPPTWSSSWIPSTTTARSTRESRGHGHLTRRLGRPRPLHSMESESFIAILLSYALYLNTHIAATIQHIVNRHI